MDWAAVKLLRGAEHDVFCVTLPGVGCGSAGPPVPPAWGLPWLQLDPKVEKSPLLPAALTQQPAPPWEREAKWIQDPHGLMESQAQPGFAQRFSSFPSCLMCVGTFYSSASCTHRFFISSPFLGLPTYITLRGSFFVVLTTWHKNERGTFRQKAEEPPVSPLPPQWDTPQTIPPCSFLKGIHGKHSPEKTPGCVYPVSHGCA